MVADHPGREARDHRREPPAATGRSVEPRAWPREAESPDRTEIITDKIDKKKLDQINQLIANFLGKNPLISDIHNLKVRSDNKKLHISFHGVIKGKTGIVEAHDLTHNFEEYLKDALPDAEKVTIHIEPEKCV